MFVINLSGIIEVLTVYYVLGGITMTLEKIYLTEDKRVTLTAYIQECSKEIAISGFRPSVLVCPGGGYCFTSDREAEPIALAYLAKGFNAFVLRYSVGEYASYPTPLVELSKAMKIIRNNAEKWYCDPDRIAVCGFSAGGHLVATLGTLWNDEYIQKESGCTNGENKPNALILGYPVITSGIYSHAGSINMLLQKDLNNEELKNKLSCEKNVGIHTPPTFIFHTFTDNAVPVENALLFSSALAKANVPFELHIFQDGAHGLALSNHCTYVVPDNLNEDAEKWMELSISWLWNLFGKRVPEKGLKLTAEQRCRGSI